jgi:hypothetical protein
VKSIPSRVQDCVNNRTDTPGYPYVNAGVRSQRPSDEPA